MMRPTLYQLIQYVRDGETDPGVNAALRADPDSDRKLRQARFICKMIGRQDKPEPPSVEPRSMTFESLGESLERLDSRREVMQRADLRVMASESPAQYEPEGR